jgi:hypothetical protein
MIDTPVVSGMGQSASEKLKFNIRSRPREGFVLVPLAYMYHFNLCLPSCRLILGSAAMLLVDSRP